MDWDKFDETKRLIVLGIFTTLGIVACFWSMGFGLLLWISGAIIIADS